MVNLKYNLLKIAASSLNYKLSEVTKAKISKSLKGVYTKEKSPWFGKSLTEKTKGLMSLKKQVLIIVYLEKYTAKRLKN